MSSRTSFTVETNGQTLIVAITAPTGRTLPALYSDVSLSSAVTFPNTITSNTTYYAANVPTDVIVSVKQPDGTELHGLAVKLEPGTAKTISPLPSAAQASADLQRGLTLAPTGALAQTFDRRGATLGNQTINSGRLYLSAIYLHAGTVVTSATYLSGSTQLSVGTNQWFALYNSAYGRLAVTGDDTSTAWSANATKTLSFSSPYTTTYTGLHYVGLMVAASTPPTLNGYVTTNAVNGLAPVLSGAMDTGLTNPASAPSTATLAQATGTTFYAYVS